MSLEEVKNMYEKEVAVIFPYSKPFPTGSWMWAKMMEAGSAWPVMLNFGSFDNNKEEQVEMVEEHEEDEEKKADWWGFGRLRLPKTGGLPYYPYSQAGLETVLKKTFGADATLKSVPKDPNSSIAAAVARRHHKGSMDQLEIFDTEGGISYKLVEVLKASACAPVYFETPTKIDGTAYVDGGVGGNCPLVQAIPRMNEIMGTAGRLQVAISIAPPAEEDEKTQNSWREWLPWFPTQLTDGYAGYHDQEKSHPDTTFVRLAPASKEAKAFNMDSLDVPGMITSVR
jgi:predicted acylesterase/phospholipase RssA